MIITKYYTADSSSGTFLLSFIDVTNLIHLHFTKKTFKSGITHIILSTSNKKNRSLLGFKL